MHDILITGATGTVGTEVLKGLQHLGGDYRISAGVRDPQADGPAVRARGAEPVAFDFADPKSVGAALDRCDVLFLLRPPQLADVQRYFAPLVRLARERDVGHIVFLSVQGADRNSMIPHHKIERLLAESGIPYTFLRPAYFMQNFTTTLREDLVRRDQIYLPAGRSKFTIIDVADIGRVAAHVLSDPGAHAHTAYDLTNDELLNFGEMAKVFSQVLGRQIAYRSPNPLTFFFTKRREGLAASFVLIMTALHFLPRFFADPVRTEHVRRITGQTATRLATFVDAHRSQFAADQ